MKVTSPGNREKQIHPLLYVRIFGGSAPLTGDDDDADDAAAGKSIRNVTQNRDQSRTSRRKEERSMM